MSKNTKKTKKGKSTRAYIGLVVVLAYFLREQGISIFVSIPVILLITWVVVRISKKQNQKNLPNQEIEQNSYVPTTQDPIYQELEPRSYIREVLVIGASLFLVGIFIFTIVFFLI